MSTLSFIIYIVSMRRFIAPWSIGTWPLDAALLPAGIPLDVLRTIALP